MNSHASSPTAIAAPPGIDSPYCAVTDHVPTCVSASVRSLRIGHVDPSTRTSIRPLSTRYAPVTSGDPSTRTSASEPPHVQLSEHVPQPTPNQKPAYPPPLLTVAPSGGGCAPGHGSHASGYGVS